MYVYSAKNNHNEQNTSLVKAGSDLRDKLSCDLLPTIGSFLEMWELVGFEAALGVMRVNDEIKQENKQRDNMSISVISSKRVPAKVFSGCWKMLLGKISAPDVDHYHMMKQKSMAPSHYLHLYKFALGDVEYFKSIGEDGSWVRSVVEAGECLMLIPGKDSGLVFNILVRPFFVNGQDQLDYQKRFGQEESYTLAHLAAYFGQANLLKNLLESKVFPIEVKDALGRTPLAMAAHGRQLECVKILLRAGANVGAVDNFQRTPLHGAAISRDSIIVEELIKAKANVNKSANFEPTIPHPYFTSNNLTPLHVAVMEGNPGSVQALVNAKADLKKKAVFGKIKTDGKEPILHLAIENRRRSKVSIVQTLVDAKADVNATNDDRRTPLHKAVEERNSNIVQALIKARADINLKDSHGQTALAMANAQQDNTIAQLLVTADRSQQVDSSSRSKLKW